jgi:hypothetical protein
MTERPDTKSRVNRVTTANRRHTHRTSGLVALIVLQLGEGKTAREVVLGWIREAIGGEAFLHWITTGYTGWFLQWYREWIGIAGIEYPLLTFESAPYSIELLLIELIALALLIIGPIVFFGLSSVLAKWLTDRPLRWLGYSATYTVLSPLWIAVRDLWIRWPGRVRLQYYMGRQNPYRNEGNRTARLLQWVAGSIETAVERLRRGLARAFDNALETVRFWGDGQ